ncbi:hypothetical protein ANN_13320 [Periplaneta americana]|uniref:Uncharacterized protein n=1 Tax=Periplaneta americana TaxID=6978 RepID=A0ABQ8TJ44_PERAM|nr:hypothetical protein ANN_13320 [Periplaneta americana]
MSCPPLTSGFNVPNCQVKNTMRAALRFTTDATRATQCDVNNATRLMIEHEKTSGMWGREEAAHVSGLESIHTCPLFPLNYGITNYRHFDFNKDWPKEVHVKTDIDGAITVFIINSNMNVQSSDFPEEIIPEGLTHQKKEYLCQRIRPFYLEGTEDLLCPQSEEVEKNISPVLQNQMEATALQLSKGRIGKIRTYQDEENEQNSTEAQLMF